MASRPNSLPRAEVRRTAARLVAAAIVVPIAAALLRYEAGQAGLLTVPQGIAVMTAVTILAVGAVAWWSIRRLLDAVDGIEAEQERRNDAERGLRLALARNRTAERVLRRGSWEWDIRTNRAEWSVGMYELFGLDPATFVNSNENFLALVHPDDRARLGEAMAAALANPGPFFQEYRLRRPDGVEIAVRGEGDVELEPDGKVSRLFGFVQDVTALRVLEDQRRKAEERFRRIFEASPVAIGLTKEDGPIVDANAAFCQLMGRERGELTAAGFHAAHLYEDPEERQRLLVRLRESGLVRGQEVGLRRPDGSIRHALASMEFLDLGGDTTILSVFQDVTDRRAAQMEREARISSEAELERLRRTDQFRVEFINSTAHELATPLTPLVLHARLLREDPSLSATQRRAAEAITRSVERLHHVVKDMVQAADLQARTMSLDRQRLNLSRLVAAAVAGHQDAAYRANLTLEAGPDAALTVVADEARLQLALGHLLGNAIKFTPAGGRITVAARRVGDAARVEVTDTGIGLTRRQLDLLWKPYSQAHDKAQRTDSGSGLGLYVTKGILDLHRGEVGASSPGPGQGSTFWFSLPLAPGHVDPLASRPAAPEPPKRANLNPGVGEEP